MQNFICTSICNHCCSGGLTHIPDNKLLSNDRLKVTIFHTPFSIIFTLLYWWPDAHPRQHTQITFFYMMTLCEHTLYTQIAMLFILQTDSQNARPVGEQTTFRMID